MLGALVLVLAVVGAAVLLATGTGPFGSGVSARGERTRPGLTAPTPSTETSPSPTSTSAPGSSGIAPSDFSAVYAAVESGVGLVVVATCHGQFSGTGFLVGATTVVTAAHVVADATHVQFAFDGNPVDATVVGVDSSIDLAVLSIPADSSARHVFDLAAQDPPPGTHIAVIGFPLDEPKSLTEGTVSGLGRSITTETGTYYGLLQTDAAINPGNSGGPLLNDSGEVVGLADAIRADATGIGFAVPISQARADIESGAGLSSPAQPPCEHTSDLVGSGVRTTLRDYFRAINAGDYATAMSLVSSAIRAQSPESQWRSDFATTPEDELRIHSVTGSSASARVWATFRSRQSPGYGPAGARSATCLLWSIDYAMTRQSYAWITDSVSAHTDPPWVRCD